ncbi:MAG: TIGR03936 family radical SAM-associated protein [Christensenellaceae bacterium]
MILFRYTKCDGAEFLSHLDLLRHIDRTLRRAGIPVKRSEAVNRHPRIYLSAPLGVGISSRAEFCTVDTDFDGDFQTLFNANAPRGVRCLSYIHTEKNVNVAFSITAYGYLVRGAGAFPAKEILEKQEIVLTEKRGRTKDVRPSLLELEWREEGLYMKLAAGTQTLRPDVLGEYLAGLYGGGVTSVEKREAFGLEEIYGPQKNA